MVFENTYFTFFQNSEVFLTFLKMTCQKNVENVTKFQNDYFTDFCYIKLLAYTVHSETTNNYIYIQHYIKLMIKIWPI